MTLEASSDIVFATTAPQPSSKALAMTLALVPGGPEPMTKGLGSLRPLTVVARVGMSLSAEELHEDEEHPEREAERDKQIVIVERVQRWGARALPAGRDGEEAG